MRPFLLSLTFALFLPLALLAGPPVEVPSEVRGEVSDFVTVLAKTDGKVVRFVVLDPGLKQFPAHLLSEKKAGVFTAAKEGRYRVLAYSSVKDDPSEPAIFVVVIGNPAPGPTPPAPNPGPGPGPAPVKPDGKQGLIKVSREGASTVRPTAGETAKLAKAQRGVASAVAAGGLTQPADILKAWREANNAAADPTVWKPWGVATSAALSKLYTDGKLATKDNWVDAFNELAAGLEDL